jgi:hypothetical protein
MMFVRGRRSRHMMLLLFCFFKKLALKAADAIATMKKCARLATVSRPEEQVTD